MSNISEIAKKLSERITNAETRKRSRTADEYQRFLYAIEYILTDIWKSSFIHPESECSIHKHNNYYFSNWGLIILNICFFKYYIRISK